MTAAPYLLLGYIVDNILAAFPLLEEDLQLPDVDLSVFEHVHHVNQFIHARLWLHLLLGS